MVVQMDLVEWKNIENSCEISIRNAKITIEIETIMLKHSKREIKKLKGKTSEEEKEELKNKTGNSDEVQINVKDKVIQ